MGWLFNSHTRRELIAHLTRARSWPVDATTRHQTAIAHTSAGYMVLWIVFEDVVAYDGGYAVDHGRWIACMLLQKSEGLWGYKDLDESMHPYYYSCPLKYLDMVDPTDPLNTCISPEWRAGVYEYWAKRRAKRTKISV